MSMRLEKLNSIGVLPSSTVAPACHRHSSNVRSWFAGDGRLSFSPNLAAECVRQGTLPESISSNDKGSVGHIQAPLRTEGCWKGSRPVSGSIPVGRHAGRGVFIGEG